MRITKLTWPFRPVLLAALLLAIPAFYLILPDSPEQWRLYGSMLHGAVALLFGIEIAIKRFAPVTQRTAVLVNDWLLLAGALLGAWPTAPDWSPIEWILRLAFSGLVFTRLMFVLAQFIRPNRILQILGFGIVVFALAGAGFLLLDPQIHSYADGIWLAFTTGATVGFGDLVPSTPASRIFAVFIVLLGYALFSTITASIAALLVGEDEEQLRKEMHADMRRLHHEVIELRRELREANRQRGRHGEP